MSGLDSVIKIMNQQNFYFMLPEVILTIGILAVLVLTVMSNKKTAQENSILMQISFFFVVTALFITGWNFYHHPPFPPEQVMFGSMTADIFSYLMRMIILASAAISIAIAHKFLEQTTRLIGDFYILVMGATLGGLFLASASDLVMVFAGLETLSITSYILAGYLRKDAKSAEASLKYLLYGGVGTAIFLFGFSLLYGLTGSTSFSEIATVMAHYQGMVHPTIIVVLLFVMATLAFKLSSVPFHMWTPDVYEGAPAPVGAFLSAVSKTAAFAITLRILLVLFGDFIELPVFWGILSVLSMTVGNFVALKQKDIKRLLAYSTIAHAGYMLLGLVVGTTFGLSGLIYYLITYVFMNLGAFASVIYFGNLTGRSDIDSYSGLFHKRPGLALGFSVCLLSLTGIPFTSGFFAKFFLFQAVALAGPMYLWIVVIALINSTISLAYYINIIRLMVVKEPSSAVNAIAAMDEDYQAITPRPLPTAMAFCVVITLVLGIFASPFFTLSTMAAKQLSQERPLIVGQVADSHK